MKLALWDTAGAERFRSLTPSFYRGAQGAILVYDVTRRDSLARLDSWFNELEVYTTRDNVVKMVVGNKIDKDNREVTREEGLRWARKHSSLFIEASARTKEGVRICCKYCGPGGPCRGEKRRATRVCALPQRFRFTHHCSLIDCLSTTVEELVEKILQTPGLWEEVGKRRNIKLEEEEEVARSWCSGYCL